MDYVFIYIKKPGFTPLKMKIFKKAKNDFIYFTK